jgi:hypothetical protein
MDDVMWTGRTGLEMHKRQERHTCDSGLAVTACADSVPYDRAQWRWSGVTCEKCLRRHPQPPTR